MVKIEETKGQFTPIKLVIETKEEFNFLKGLFNAGIDIEKKNASYFDEYMDKEMWQVLEDYKKDYY